MAGLFINMSKTYAEKLKDPRWQRKRLEIMQRDDFTCRRCKSKTKTLHIHHIRYIKGADPWSYREYYLVTLCERCHQREEREIKTGVTPADGITSRLDAMIDSAPERPLAPMDETAPWDAATPCHRSIGYLCYLALKSQDARTLLLAKLDLFAEVFKWVEGVPLLLLIIKSEHTPSREDEFISSLADPYRRALINACVLENDIQSNINEEVNRAVDLVDMVMLQRKSAAIKQALGAPGIPRDRLHEMLDQMKEVSGKIRLLSKRSDHDDAKAAESWKLFDTTTK